MSLGTLRVLLGLDAAEFTTGLTKAEARLKRTEQQVKNFSSALQKDIAFGVGKAITALTALDRVGGFLIRFGFDAINAAASFEDLGEKTGGSAEKLASFQTAADITKTSMESVGEALVKLTKGLAGADEETKGAANAVQKLGFNLAEFKELDSATQFEQLAKRLNEFADSNTKTSAAVQLFGKAGANQLSLMKELANQTDRSTILTKAHIKTADDFADKQAKVTSELKQYAGVVGIAVLPVLTELSKAFVDVVKSMTSVDKQTGTLRASNAVRDWAESAAIAVAILAESLFALGKLFVAIGGSFRAVAADIALPAELITAGKKAIVTRDLSGIKAVLDERNRIVEEANQRYVDLWNFNSTAMSDALRKNFALQRELEGDSAGDQVSRRFNRVVTKPKLPDWFGGGKSDKATKAAQEAKKLLDKQLSDIDNFIKAEKRLFETRESDLARLYQSDQLSITAYFDERLAALDRNTTATVDLYDKQIKAQESFAAAAKRRNDEPAVIDAQKQIGDIQARIADVLHEKQQRALKLDDDRTQATQAYADQVDEVRARVLELLGTEQAALEAAKLRFDVQNRSVIQGAKREKDPALEADIAALRKQADAQTQINVLLKDAGVIEQNLATAQAKLHLERDLGMRDEITTLDLVGKASGEAAAQLKLIADQYLAIAVASKDPQIIANALALKQRVDELAAATDILAAKIRQTFVDTGASAIETFLNSVAEGKNVLDSFANAFKQFANDIIRQINRIAAQKIADSLFKSGSGGDGGIFGDIADAFVAYIGGLGGRERGGPVSGKTPYVVGERGPEIFVPRTVAAEATKQIDSLIAQKGKPVEYTERVKAATVATNLPHLIGAKGPEIFVPKMDGIVISNDKVNKLSRVLQGRANGGPVVSATPYIVGERGPEIFTPRNAATLGPHEKVVTRLVSSVQPKASQVASNMPRVVGARGPELFVSKAAGIIIQNDKVAKLAKSFGNDRPKVPSYSPPGGTPRLAGQMLAVGRSSQPTDFDLNSERSSLAIRLLDFERKAVVPAAAVARRREISAPLVAARTIMRNEKIITRYANAPYSRRASGSQVAAHVHYIVDERGRKIFIPKPAAVQRDEAVSKLSTAVQKQSQSGVGKSLGLSERGKAGGAEVVEKFKNLLIFQWGYGGAEQPPAQGRGTSASVASRWSAASAAIASGASATTALRIISKRAPQVYIQQSANAILQSKRAVAELVAKAPRQRRAGGGLVAAGTPYVVGELGPELFMPKSVGRIIKHEKAIDDLVSNKIQHRATSEPNVTYILGGHEVFISKLASTNIKSEKFINDLVSNTAQHSASVKNERVHNNLVSNTRNQKILNQLVSNIQRGPFAAHQTYLINEREIPRSARKVIADDKAVARVRSPLPERQQHQLAGANVVKHEKAIDDVSNTILPYRASSGSVAANVLSEVSKLVSTDIKNEKFITDIVSNSVQRRAIGSPIATRTPYIIGELGAEVFMPKAARRIIKNDLVSNTRNEKTINQLVSNIQRRPFAPSQTYLVDEFVPKSASKVVKNEKVIYDLVTNTIQQHRARGGPVHARPYIVGERGSELFVTRSAEKIIKNESRVSELVTNNARRNEKVINDLVSKTVHHRERSVATPPDVAAKIIKNESRISELVSNNVQRNEEIINRLVTTTRRDSGRTNEMLIVGAHGPELFIPKVAGRIIKNERRINELVSNIEHHNIDRRSEKNIDEIISSTVQRRANGGPVGAYQKYLVGERGPELYVPKAGEIKVPSDFFTNEQYRRARGGAVVANRPYIVGERGPETFIPKTAGRIVQSTSTNSNTFVFNMSGGANMNRQTQQQLFADAAQAFARSNRRLN